MTQERRDQLVPMKKVLYFRHNMGQHRIKMIESISGGDRSLEGHLVEKFSQCGHNFHEFFFELDGELQRKALEYILDNYDGVKSV